MLTSNMKEAEDSVDSGYLGKSWWEILLKVLRDTLLHLNICNDLFVILTFTPPHSESASHHLRATQRWRWSASGLQRWQEETRQVVLLHFLESVQYKCWLSVVFMRWTTSSLHHHFFFVNLCLSRKNVWDNVIWIRKIRLSSLNNNIYLYCLANETGWAISP